jgi:polyvinyl alcohol dehydrogenase (cytochrome)
MRWWKRAVLVGALGGMALVSACSGDDEAGGDEPGSEPEPEPAAAITLDNVADLTEAWRVDGQLGVTGKPVVRDGVVYFGNWKGQAAAVELGSGEVVWQTLVAEDESVTLDAAPLVTDDRVYLPDGGGSLHAVDRANGEELWSVVLDPHPNVRIFSTPMLAPSEDGDSGVIVIGVASTELRQDLNDYTFRGSVLGLDEETGDELWRSPTSSDADGAGISVWSSAAIDEERGLAFIGTGQAYETPAGPLSDAILALDYTTGEKAWHRQFTEGDVFTYPDPRGPDADVGATPTLFTIGDRDVVGVGDKGGSFAVFDRETGETVWTRELTAGSPLGGVMVTAAHAESGPEGAGGADGVIYVASNTIRDFTPNSENNASTTFALDAATGEVLWQQELAGATFGSLTYADGVVYRPSVPGPLQALDGATGEILWTVEPGGDMGAGVRVTDGHVLVPHGFWFGADDRPPGQADEDLPGGVVAYTLP